MCVYFFVKLYSVHYWVILVPSIVRYNIFIDNNLVGFFRDLEVSQDVYMKIILIIIQFTTYSIELLKQCSKKQGYE